MYIEVQTIRGGNASKKELIKTWESGVDFKLVLTGQYCSNRDGSAIEAQFGYPVAGRTARGTLVFLPLKS